MPDHEKPDEQKTERFNMFMSPSEMKAIDDWMWANRIRSKSEAVRRLVQIGKLADFSLEGIVDSAQEILNQARRDFLASHKAVRAVDARLNEIREDDLRDDISQVLHALVDRSLDIYEATDEFFVLVLGLYNGIAPYSTAKTVAEGAIESERYHQEATRALEGFEARRAERWENSVIATVMQAMSAEERDAYEALSEDDKEAWWEKKIEEARGAASDNPQVEK